MKKHLFLIILLSVFTFSCSNDDMIVSDTDQQKETPKIPLDDEYVEPGIIRIKLKAEAEAQLDIRTKDDGTLITGVASIDQLISQLKVTEIKRTFRHGGDHENKMRKAGLHLWYDIIFDPEQPMTKSYSTVLNVKDAMIVEPVMKIRRIDPGKTTPLTQELAESLVRIQTKATSDIPKIDNPLASLPGAKPDPYLSYQWHYHNEGTLRNSIPAADINLYKAWEIETGKPQVIVAIIDGGIEITHPDLAQNLWVNEAELNGIKGVDDNDAIKGKSYIDDIHGYNFVYETGEITGHEHGTHVAGTVAAVNNNGIGVAGVAGGNGSKDSGVRLMSCQIFAYDKEGKEVYAEKNKQEAFVYAANNGAVIAQNSWAYNWTGSEMDLLEVDKDAINYFIENAGTDKDGNQVGPMKGGIVIFAAGNDNIQGKAMPASYEKVFAVASFAPNYTKAIYSNYGSWVELAGPGGAGDYFQGTQVFSTFLQGQYGYQEGTSMACPHVSGIAALIVSKYGVNPDGTFKSFTCEDLKARLLNSTNDYTSWYNTAAFPIGKGYINAYKALADPGQLAPDRVSDIQAKWVADKVTLTWRVTSDDDDATRKAYGYKILLSEDDLYGVDFDRLPVTANVITVLSGAKNVGDVLTQEINNLTVEKTYYVSIAAFDMDGNTSLSSTIKGTTVPNSAPVAEGLPSAIALKKDEVKEILLTISDHEGDAWTYTFTQGSSAATITPIGTDQLLLKINATVLTPGQSYEATLILRDAQGKENVISIPYAVVNNAPTLLQSFENVLFQYIGEEKVYNLNDYFIDKDKDAITFEVESANTSVATATLNSDVLTVKAVGIGTSRITVTAKDPFNGQTGSGFDITSRNENISVDLYPVPVKKDGLLNIRMGRFVKGTIDVTLYTLAGAKVFNQKVDINPDNPAQINISSLKTGNYQVVIKYKQQEITRNITKL